MAAWLFFQGVAHGQNQRLEFLNIENPTDRPIWVSVRANGRGSPNGNWQREVKIDAAPDPPNTVSVGTIQLQGFEPFDISIRKPDGTYTILRNVRLCWMMKECARTGKTDWLLRGKEGRWESEVSTAPARKRFVETQALELYSTCDANQVTIQLSPLMGKKPDDPPPPPPPPR
jgi:hypothetical protein